ncbi:MAG: class I SAM-dependent methyltransferase, partial [Planctomycetota bacterium]
LYLKTFRRRRNFVREHVPPGGKILDVGCAAGYFLRVMRDAGHEVYGVELSAPIAKHAIEHLGEDHIHVGTLESAAEAEGFEPGSFDLVTFWDVIEHVPDPQALLRQAAAMLKPGGSLIIETQNVDSRFAGLLGRRWHHYKHEEHIYHFSPRTIERLLEQGGFEMTELTSAYGGKYVSFGFIAERAARLGPLIGFLLKPLNLLKKANLYLNLRDEIVVVARPTS